MSRIASLNCRDVHVDVTPYTFRPAGDEVTCDEVKCLTVLCRVSRHVTVEMFTLMSLPFIFHPAGDELTGDEVKCLTVLCRVSLH